MMNTTPYSGSLTAEQFLFYEIRIASKLYLQGISVDDAAAKIREDNLFQYPTERQISRMARACYRRLDALNNQKLIKEISSAPTEIAKQINLYAIMRYNRLVWDFMIQVIGEKFRTQDYSFERKDLNTFFSRLQAQNDSIGQIDRQWRVCHDIISDSITSLCFGLILAFCHALERRFRWKRINVSRTL